MTEERYEVYIGPNYDMIFDTRTKTPHNGIEVAEMLNQYDEQVQKLSKALTRSIEDNIKLKKKIRRMEHESYGCEERVGKMRIDRFEPSKNGITDNNTGELLAYLTEYALKLNELNYENIELKSDKKYLKDKHWKIMEIIIEGDTTNKYKDADEVVAAIKKVLGLRMIE